MVPACEGFKKAFEGPAFVAIDEVSPAGPRQCPIEMTAAPTFLSRICVRSDRAGLEASTLKIKRDIAPADVKMALGVKVRGDDNRFLNRIEDHAFVLIEDRNVCFQLGLPAEPSKVV